MSDILITLPDGSERAYPPGSTAGDVARSIGPRLAKAAVAATVEGEEWDLERPLPERAAVAIITDGNGRWASERGLPAIEGHRAGADVVKERLRDAASLGVEELTVFSFSTENWRRGLGPAAEGLRPAR